MTDVKRYDCTNGGAKWCQGCYQMSEHPQGDYVAADDYAKLEAEAQAPREEVEKAQNALAFTEQWYGVRYERLWHWAHAELDEEQKRRYFNIVANGTAEHSEPPTYAQQLCRMKNRYECAEKEVAALRARVVVIPEHKDDLPPIYEDENLPAFHHYKGWNACLDELARLNGLTVSEALLRRLCEPLLSHADYVVARNELRALLSEQEGGKQ